MLQTPLPISGAAIMWRTVVAVSVVLNLAACPYVCGSVFAVTEHDDCCPAEKPEPAKQPSSEPCQARSCICTGAPAPESVRLNQEITRGLPPSALVCTPLIADAIPTAVPPMPGGPDNRPPIYGVTLRALLQSFLL